MLKDKINTLLYVAELVFELSLVLLLFAVPACLMLGWCHF